jgi:hypothetical protein
MLALSLSYLCGLQHNASSHFLQQTQTSNDEKAKIFTCRPEYQTPFFALRNSLSHSFIPKLYRALLLADGLQAFRESKLNSFKGLFQDKS